MSQGIIFKGRCGREIRAKVWKGGGTAKCPDHWTFNTYPAPSDHELAEKIYWACSNCESLASDIKGLMSHE